MDIDKIAILETSRAVEFLKIICKRYFSSKKLLGDIYRNSLLYKVIRLFANDIIFAFRYSSLGMITEIESNDSREIMRNSRFIKLVLRIWDCWKNKINNCLATSITANRAIWLKNKSHLLPVKTGSIILITAVIFDTAFQVLLNNETGTIRWVTRGLLLFVGLAGLSCRIGLKDLLSTSSVLKWATGYKEFPLEER